MGNYFGTDGIRGTYGDPFINPGFAYRLGASVGQVLAARKPGMPLNAAIGRDTRASGQELADAVIQGLNLYGVYVHDLGIVPTPAIAQAVVEHRTDIGVAVTASHNPASDNGIKFFNASGFKLSDEEEAEIEAILDASPEAPTERPMARAFPLDGAAFYINYLRSLMDENCMNDWTIVLDTAHGATCETTPAVFRRWGAALHLIGDNPDGENINRGVGSEHPEQLAEAVKAKGANIGIAHDGDGDRLVVCDDEGVMVDGDIILGLFGVYALKSKSLGQNTLVATVHSNLGLDRAIEAAGGRVERVAVGDRNVASKMREIGSNVGGESSGHIILSDFATTGDGLLAAVKLIELMCKTGRPLSELRKEVALFPQKSASLKVREKKPLDTLNTLADAIRAAEARLGRAGRVLVRYSGTEPKLRLLVEGKEAAQVEAILGTLQRAAETDLDVIED